MKKASNKDKVIFIKWLLENYDFKKEGIEEILIYLLNNQEVMHKIEFVDTFIRHKNSLIVQTKESPSDLDLVFKSDIGHIVSKPEKALSYIKEFVYQFDETLNIIVLFNGINALEYRKVINGGNLSEFDLMIQEIEKQNEIFLIQQEIDESLEKYDKEKFMELSSKLKAIIG